MEASYHIFRLIPDFLFHVLAYGALFGLGLLSLLVLQSFDDEIPPPAGCKRLGLSDESHIADEYHRKYLSVPSSSAPIRIKSLFIYPIKSCRGIELSHSLTCPTGLLYDRHFSFAQLRSPFPLSASDSAATASAHSWKFITQREFPLLSQLRTTLYVPDPASPSYSPSLPYVLSRGAIVATFPYRADGPRGLLALLSSLVLHLRHPTKSFVLPFDPSSFPPHLRPARGPCPAEPFTIWKETLPATNVSCFLPPELAFFLGVRNPLALFRVAAPRQVFRNAPRRGEQVRYQPVTGFADAFPVHLLGVESVRALEGDQARGSPRLSVVRFRANMVVEGAGAYGEERWKRVRIGAGEGAEWYVACRCVRCLMPNVEPETGLRHGSEPNRTLRRARCVDKGAPMLGCLGMNLVPAEDGMGQVRVGDEVVVLEEGEHVYIPI